MPPTSDTKSVPTTEPVELAAVITDGDGVLTKEVFAIRGLHNALRMYLSPEEEELLRLIERKHLLAFQRALGEHESIGERFKGTDYMLGAIWSLVKHYSSRWEHVAKVKFKEFLERVESGKPIDKEETARTVLEALKSYGASADEIEPLMVTQFQAHRFTTDDKTIRELEPEIPGAARAIAGFQKKGIHVAVATNTPPDAAKARLEAIGVDTRITPVYSSRTKHELAGLLGGEQKLGERMGVLGRKPGPGTHMAAIYDWIRKFRPDKTQSEKGVPVLAVFDSEEDFIAAMSTQFLLQYDFDHLAKTGEFRENSWLCESRRIFNCPFPKIVPVYVFTGNAKPQDKFDIVTIHSTIGGWDNWPVFKEKSPSEQEIIKARIRNHILRLVPECIACPSIESLQKDIEAGKIKFRRLSIGTNWENRIEVYAPGYESYVSENFSDPVAEKYPDSYLPRVQSRWLVHPEIKEKWHSLGAVR
jgi:phosphoglycolate phosphatase-like HAD superfamily hydrolase